MSPYRVLAVFRSPLATAWKVSKWPFTNISFANLPMSSNIFSKASYSVSAVDQLSASSNGNKKDVKEEILLKSLDFVEQHGWTTQALAKGAEACGLPTISHGLFQRGPIELINFFYESSNRRLLTAMELEAKSLPSDKHKSINVVVRDALEMRLRMVVPYRRSWPQALALMLLPQYAFDGLHNAGQLADTIWHGAGDKSTDVNWYTKRSIVAAVYQSSELVLLQDESPDFVQTWSFLDKRLHDAATVSTYVHQANQACDTAGNLLQAAFIVGRNVLGNNSRFR